MERTFSVLLVEDCNVDQYTAQEALLSYCSSIEIVTAKNGEEAIHHLGSGYVPDFILLDMNMPRMNGLEFLEYYAENANYHSPVFIISSSSPEQDMKAVEHYPFVKKHLAKPFDNDILDAIRF